MNLKISKNNLINFIIRSRANLITKNLQIPPELVGCHEKDLCSWIRTCLLFLMIIVKSRVSFFWLAVNHLGIGSFVYTTSWLCLAEFW